MMNKKITVALIACFTIAVLSSEALAQTPPSPPAGGPPSPPNPPPSPSEVFNKINPFKKKKADTSKSRSNTKVAAPAVAAGTGAVVAAPTPPPGGPPPPPNPLNLFRKKRDTSKKAVPAPAKPPL